MNLEQVRNLAEDYAKKFNPDGFSPFPFDHIELVRGDVKIVFTEKLSDSVSGVIGFSNEQGAFVILVNSKKSRTRQYFTVAHELGHYFLHQAHIRQKSIVDGENVLDCDGMLYRDDEGNLTQLEIEANNFAASLIMPGELVRKAWDQLHSVEECAQVFHVSIAAMSIRLIRLKLVD